MTHCEDSGIISDNMKKAKSLYGDDPDIIHHHEIRSEEACIQSSKLAVELALSIRRTSTLPTFRLPKSWICCSNRMSATS